MIGRLIGAAVGREVGKRVGRGLHSRFGGVGGAAAGWLATGLLRRMGPMGMVIGGGYAAKKALDAARRRD